MEESIRPIEKRSADVNYDNYEDVKESTILEEQTTLIPDLTTYSNDNSWINGWSMILLIKLTIMIQYNK